MRGEVQKSQVRHIELPVFLNIYIYARIKFFLNKLIIFIEMKGAHLKLENRMWKNMKC